MSHDTFYGNVKSISTDGAKPTDPETVYTIVVQCEREGQIFDITSKCSRTELNRILKTRGFGMPSELLGTKFAFSTNPRLHKENGD